MTAPEFFRASPEEKTILLLLAEEDAQSGPAPTASSSLSVRPDGPPETWTVAQRQAYVRGDFE